MLWLTGLAAALAAPQILDEGDAAYLAQTKRARAAADWYTSRMQAEPDETRWVAAYLGTLSQLPQDRHPALAALAEQWRADHPDAVDAGILVARAAALESLGQNTRASDVYVQDATPWCGRAVAALSTLPAEPGPRIRVLDEQLALPPACGVDREAVREQRLELALQGHGEPIDQAIAALIRDPEAALDVVQLTVAESPWAVADFGPILSREEVGSSPAVAWLLDESTRLAGSDRPSRVFAAGRLLHAAGDMEGAQAAYARVLHLDSGNPVVPTLLPSARPSEPVAEESLPDRPPDSFYAKRRYWAERVEQVRSSGDQAALLRVLERQWRGLGYDPHLEFIELAAARGERLRAARRALKQTRPWFVTPPPFALGGDPEWTERYGAFLEVESELHAAHGDPQAATGSLELALQLAPPTATRLAELGLRYAEQDRPAQAAPLLATALAEPTGLDAALVARCRAALQAVLPQTGWWLPVPFDAWIDLHAPGDATAPPSAADPERYRDLRARFEDDRAQPLFPSDVPVVVELWASWCGPCKQLLPHLDRLATARRGQARFVALSVDEQEERARAWMARQGDVSYVPAWSDQPMEELGVPALPVVLLLDERGRLVEQISGWSPGSRSLDRAVDALLSKPRSPKDESGG